MEPPLVVGGEGDVLGDVTLGTGGCTGGGGGGTKELTGAGESGWFSPDLPEAVGPPIPVCRFVVTAGAGLRIGKSSSQVTGDEPSGNARVLRTFGVGAICDAKFDCCDCLVTEEDVWHSARPPARRMNRTIRMS